MVLVRTSYTVINSAERIITYCVKLPGFLLGWSCLDMPRNALEDLTDFEKKYTVYITDFYRAMHFSAKRGIAIASRPSVCPSATLVD